MWAKLEQRTLIKRFDKAVSFLVVVESTQNGQVYESPPTRSGAYSGKRPSSK